MNQERATGSGADEQRADHAGKTPPLHDCRGPVGEVARKEYDGCGRSGRKYTLDMKGSNRGALHSHREPPQAEENVGDVNRRLAVAGKPDGQESSMRDQRYTQRNRPPLGPSANILRMLDDARLELNSRGEGGF